MLFNPNTNRLYALAVTIDPVAGFVKAIDPTTLDVEADIPVDWLHGLDGWAMNLRTNRLYVIDGNRVHVIDGDPASGDFNTVIADISVANHAEGIAINEGTNFIYVGETRDDAPSDVYVIDGTTNTVIKEIEVGNDAEVIAVNQTTNLIYTSNNWSDSISVIDGEPASPSFHTVIETISLDASPEELLVNENTNRLYVDVEMAGDTTIVVIDCHDHSIEEVISLHSAEGELEFALDSTVDYIYAANDERNVVYVIDGDPESPLFNSIVETVGVGRSPQSMVVDPMTHRVYVANEGDDTVSVIIWPDTDGDGLLDIVETDTRVFVDARDTGSDPFDPDTDNDGLGDGAEVALGTDPNRADHDGDGVCDGGGTGDGACDEGPDNCPFISNPDQTDSDLLSADGLSAGDECQCGDVDYDGQVTALDATIAREHLVGATLSGAFVAERCNVIGESDGGASDCDVADIYVLERVVASESATIENTCQAYTGL